MSGNDEIREPVENDAVKIIESESLPRISVIVPVYKAEQYLDQCVQSIVDQTYRNLEIILVDDGSPDRCPRMCDDWAKKDSRIHVVHRKNGGHAAARNSGIEIATGLLMGFVDDDDYVAPDMYASMLKNLHTANADIAYTASVHVYENGQVSRSHLVPDVHLTLSNGDAFKYINLPGYFGVAPWDKLLKRSIVGDLRFPEGVLRGEDYAFAYGTLDRASTVIYDSTPKYYYRMVKNSISNTTATIDIRAVTETRKMVELVLKKYPMQLPFALYAELLTMLGTYDQVIMSHQKGKRQWRNFEVEIQHFMSMNSRTILKAVPLSRGRLLQFRLFQVSPLLYEMIFCIYKRIHPWRSA